MGMLVFPELAARTLSLLHRYLWLKALLETGSGQKEKQHLILDYRITGFQPKAAEGKNSLPVNMAGSGRKSKNYPGQVLHAFANH